MLLRKMEHASQKPSEGRTERKKKGSAVSNGTAK